MDTTKSDVASAATIFCDVCDEPIDLAKDKYARNEIPTCIPYCPELEGWTCENCREAAYDRHIESFYG